MDKSLELIEQSQHIVEAFLKRAKMFPEVEVWRQAEFGPAPRSWTPTTYKDVLSKVTALHHFLREHLGDKGTVSCAICSNTRPEWLIADLAILSVNGVTVSIYTSLPTHDAGYIVSDSEADIIFAENQSQVDKFLRIHEGFTAADGTEVKANPLKQIIAFEEVDEHPLVTQLSAILERTDKNQKEIELDPSGARDTLASLVYTSGSTGTPKGVMQTHGNHLTNVAQVLKADLFDGGAIFLYLPLAHSFARLNGYLGLLTDTSLSLPAVSNTKKSVIDLMSVSLDMKTSDAQYIPSIPRLFEKIKIAIEKQAEQSGIKGWIVRKTLQSSRANFLAGRRNEKLGAFDWFWYQVTASVRERLRDTIFGPSFVYAVSGGAKLSPTVAEFFDALGIKILQGYGLTETCVATNVNRPHHNKIGSVGPIFSDLEIKICDDGEIAFRGPNVTKGYWKKPEATKENWDSEGWFYTGDTGSIDEDGFLFIEGRKKEIIVSAGGKKIAPTKVEKKLEAISGVSQAVLFGSDRPYCVALIVPSFTIEENSSLDVEDYPELWSEIEKINETLASFEKVRKARLVREEFTPENGLLTPTMKLRRHEVRRQHRDLIWSMYDNIPHPAKVDLST